MPKLGQKNNSSSTLSDISNSDLKSYVATLKRQEGGRNPDYHKINGNMAWNERARDNSHPMNQYFNSLGRDGKKVLADLKARVPEAFGLPPASEEESNSGKSKSGSEYNNTKKPTTSKVADPKGMFGMSQTMTYAVVGSSLLLITVGAIAISN